MARGSPVAPLVKPERAEGLVGMVDQGLSCPEPGGRLSSVVSRYLEPQVAPSTVRPLLPKEGPAQGPACLVQMREVKPVMAGAGLWLEGPGDQP